MHICAIMLTYGYSYIYNYMNIVYIFIYYHFSKIYLFIYSFIHSFIYSFIHSLYRYMYIYTYTWINYNALTATSLEWWLGWYRSHGRSFFLRCRLSGSVDLSLQYQAPLCREMGDLHLNFPTEKWRMCPISGQIHVAGLIGLIIF
jgi:hypothetical protein